MDNIKIVRLQNGEDLIGDVSHKSDGSIDIYDPMVFAMDYRGKFPSLLIKHWTPTQLFQKTAINLNQSNIMFITEPTEIFLNYYTDIVNEENSEPRHEESNNESEETLLEELIDKFNTITNESNTLH